MNPGSPIFKQMPRFTTSGDVDLDGLSMAFLKFTPEFTAGNLIQAAFALIATGIVGAQIQKRLSKSRKEKDLLIDDVQSVIKLIDKLLELEISTALIETTANLKQFQVSVNNLRSCLSEFQYPNNLLILLPPEDQIVLIRKLATDTPIKDIEAHAKSKKCTASVRNGIITLTEERRVRLVNELSDARSKLQKLRLELNRR